MLFAREFGLRSRTCVARSCNRGYEGGAVGGVGIGAAEFIAAWPLVPALLAVTALSVAAWPLVPVLPAAAVAARSRVAATCASPAPGMFAPAAGACAPPQAATIASQAEAPQTQAGLAPAPKMTERCRRSRAKFEVIAVLYSRMATCAEPHRNRRVRFDPSRERSLRDRPLGSGTLAPRRRRLGRPSAQSSTIKKNLVDGHEATRRAPSLRRRGRVPEVPLIAQSDNVFGVADVCQKCRSSRNPTTSLPKVARGEARARGRPVGFLTAAALTWGAWGKRCCMAQLLMNIVELRRLPRAASGWLAGGARDRPAPVAVTDA